MGKIRIVDGGLFTTVQDRGRTGYQKFGVPVSGVMDSFSYETANFLVSNSNGEAVLEATMSGPCIEFFNNTLIAICGGDLGALINGDSIPMWQTIPVKKGDVLSFSDLKNGLRAYIAFFGGVSVDEVMESRSTYVKGGIGGHGGRTLLNGDALPIGDLEKKLQDYPVKKIPEHCIPVYSNEISIRVVPGPQQDFFTENGIRTFFSNTYKVGMEYDRMGIRLQGKGVEHKIGADIISDAISFGSVQIPPSGKPIVMMADRQTTGGYTKIATVISTDLHKLAQAKYGDKIKFKEVSIEEAVDILKKYRKSSEKIKKNLDYVIDYWDKVKINDLLRIINSKNIGYISYEDKKLKINIKK